MLNTQNSTSKDIWKERVLYNFFFSKQTEKSQCRRKAGLISCLCNIYLTISLTEVTFLSCFLILTTPFFFLFCGTLFPQRQVEWEYTHCLSSFKWPCWARTPHCCGSSAPQWFFFGVALQDTCTTPWPFIQLCAEGHWVPCPSSDVRDFSRVMVLWTYLSLNAWSIFPIKKNTQI